MYVNGEATATKNAAKFGKSGCFSVQNEVETLLFPVGICLGFRGIRPGGKISAAKEQIRKRSKGVYKLRRGRGREGDGICPTLSEDGDEKFTPAVPGRKKLYKYLLSGGIKAGLRTGLVENVPKGTAGGDGHTVQGFDVKVKVFHVLGGQHHFQFCFADQN